MATIDFAILTASFISVKSLVRWFNLAIFCDRYIFIHKDFTFKKFIYRNLMVFMNHAIW